MLLRSVLSLILILSSIVVFATRSHSSSRKRKNTSIACDECAKKKIRCVRTDDTFASCSYCLKHDSQCAVKREIRKRGRKPQKELSEMRLGWYEHVVFKVEAKFTADGRVCIEKPLLGNSRIQDAFLSKEPSGFLKTDNAQSDSYWLIGLLEDQEGALKEEAEIDGELVCFENQREEENLSCREFIEYCRQCVKHDCFPTIPFSEESLGQI